MSQLSKLQAVMQSKDVYYASKFDESYNIHTGIYLKSDTMLTVKKHYEELGYSTYNTHHVIELSIHITDYTMPIDGSHRKHVTVRIHADENTVKTALKAFGLDMRNFSYSYTQKTVYGG